MNNDHSQSKFLKTNPKHDFNDWKQFLWKKNNDFIRDAFLIDSTTTGFNYSSSVTFSHKTKTKSIQQYQLIIRAQKEKVERQWF